MQSDSTSCSYIRFYLYPLQCDQIWRNVTTLQFYLTLWQHFNDLFTIWQNFEPSLAKILCYMVNFKCCKRPNIEK